MIASAAPRPAPGGRRDVLEALPHGLLLTDPADRVVYANPPMAALAGCAAAALVGLPAAEVLPATESAWLRPTGTAAAEGVELELRRRDGGRVWVLVHAAPLAGGGWVRLVADIGERKHAESDQARLQQALTHAASEWQLTFDAVETPLLVIGADGRVARLNRAAQRLAGRGFTELIGRPLAGLGAGEPWRTAAELVRSTADRSGPRSASAREPSPGTGAKTSAGTGASPSAGTGAGRVWDLAASVTARPGEGGERIIVVMRDITGLVQLQESLRRSEVMSALGTLVAGVAHEVRNPLFGLSAVLDAFESRFGDQEAQRSYLDLMHEQVRRLNALMQQLLDYGKPPASERAPADPAEVAAEAAAGCAPLAAERGVEVAVEPGPGVPAVAMDRPRMVQAFRNLIDNAILHSPRGGRVRVALAAAADPEGDSGEECGGEDGGAARRWVAARVEDRGPGIPEEDRLRVFDPFFSRRRGGTGLGLSIVLRVVEQHGGRITAGNLPEGGAVMELLLPVAEPAGPPAEPAPAEQERYPAEPEG